MIPIEEPEKKESSIGAYVFIFLVIVLSPLIILFILVYKFIQMIKEA